MNCANLIFYICLFFLTFSLGLALKNLGRKEVKINKKVVKREKEAIKCYDEAIRLDAKYVLAWYNKGKKKRVESKDGIVHKN